MSSYIATTNTHFCQTLLTLLVQFRIAFKMSHLFATVITVPSSLPTVSNLDVHNLERLHCCGFAGLDLTALSTIATSKMIAFFLDLRQLVPS